MGSSSGSSSVELMEQRKRKRMISNRESARRSRQRKQKHLDELAAQLGQLRKENAQIVAALTLTTEHCLSVEAENGVLRAQLMELSSRLQGLTQILSCMNQGTSYDGDDDDDGMAMMMMMMRPCGLMDVGAVDAYQYC